MILKFHPTFPNVICDDIAIVLQMSGIGMTFANPWQRAANAVSILLQLVLDWSLCVTFSCCLSALMMDQNDLYLQIGIGLADWDWNGRFVWIDTRLVSERRL